MANEPAMPTPTVIESPVNWMPSLTGRVDPIVEQAILYLFRAVYSLRNGTGFGPGAKVAISDVVAPSVNIEMLSKEIAKAISASGSSPLDVTGLPGTLGTPQTAAGNAIVTALPGPNDPLSFLGNQVIFNGVPFRYISFNGSAPFWSQQVSTAAILYDTAANLVNYPAANYPVGTLYTMSDRTNVQYIVQDIGGTFTWLFYNGVYVDVLANIPTLGVNDANFQFHSSDYQQIWTWSGTVWNFSPGSGSGYYTQTNGPAPFGGVWGLADGSTYNVTQNDATLAPVVTPIAVNTWLRL